MLVVEDFEDTRYLMRLELERRGFRVLEATDGEEGVAVAAREQPDIILMDVQLIPGPDGWEATLQLRALPATRAIPVIALTAHAMSGDRERALQAGFDGYITKPIDIRSFPEAVQQMLAGETFKAGPQ